MRLLSELVICSITLVSIVSSIPMPAATAGNEKSIVLPLKLLKTSRSNSLAKRAPGFSSSLSYSSGMGEWGVEVNIGTPPQKFTLLFDTGSADTWVTVPNSKNTGPLLHFDSSKSSTYQSSNYPFKAAYINGANTTGIYFQDTVSMGASSGAVTKQTIAAVTDLESPTFTGQSGSTILDGILGASVAATSYSAIMSQSYAILPVSLYNQKLISNPLFSVAMNGNGGRVTFGAIDSSADTSKLIYSSTVKGYNWAINLDAAAYLTEGVKNPVVQTFTPMPIVNIDTGTVATYIPAQLAVFLASSTDSKYTQKVSNGVTLYYVNCAVKSKKNVVSFHMPTTGSEAGIINMALSDLVLQNSDKTCMLSFASAGNTFLIGNSWLKYFVTVFDFGQSRVGFVPV